MRCFPAHSTSDLSQHVATRLVPWATLLFACSCRRTINEWSSPAPLRCFYLDSPVEIPAAQTFLRRVAFVMAFVLGGDLSLMISSVLVFVSKKCIVPSSRPYLAGLSIANSRWLGW
jgi:hypothetical protein